jgi:hypothetical protein
MCKRVKWMIYLQCPRVYVCMSTGAKAPSLHELCFGPIEVTSLVQKFSPVIHSFANQLIYLLTLLRVVMGVVGILSCHWLKTGRFEKPSISLSLSLVRPASTAISK